MRYFREDEGHLGGYRLGQIAPGTWCPAVWDFFIDELGVRSMGSVGCGLGYDVEYFSKKGCCAVGIDGSPSAVRDNRMPANVIRHDYCEGPLVLAEPVDLVWSAEFVEHVEEQYLGNFLATFSAARMYLALTFARPGQGGHHHVNEQEAEYWIDRLASTGLSYSSELTLRTRSLLPQSGLYGMQFRDKGLVFSRV